MWYLNTKRGRGQAPSGTSRRMEGRIVNRRLVMRCRPRYDSEGFHSHFRYRVSHPALETVSPACAHRACPPSRLPCVSKQWPYREIKATTIYEMYIQTGISSHIIWPWPFLCLFFLVHFSFCCFWAQSCI
jgi:hypothetical protein